MTSPLGQFGENKLDVQYQLLFLFLFGSRPVHGEWDFSSVPPVMLPIRRGPALPGPGEKGYLILGLSITEPLP